MIDADEWAYSTWPERLRLLWWRETWPIARWGALAIMLAAALRLGFEVGRHVR